MLRKIQRQDEREQGGRFWKRNRTKRKFRTERRKGIRGIEVEKKKMGRREREKFLHSEIQWKEDTENNEGFGRGIERKEFRTREKERRRGH